jgi:hypothetical protein
MPSAEEILTRLAETGAAYPFPQSELERTRGRTWILDYAPRNAVGAEIGVFRGHFTEKLLTILTPRLLYLIDPWTLQGQDFGYVSPYTNDGKLPTAIAREEAILRAALFTVGQTALLEARFPDCLGQISERLDWAYLDASHAFDDTYRELEALDRILAPGGVILGDDWTHEVSHPHYGVCQAVNAFVRARDYQVVAAGPFMQWCIRRRP